eukprot:TRINITY_DN3828_c0_g1_i1.p1 TRINITY_DN3828_c0_g1~~TRINITY_DN3828_c0_g1_i1.p1  ORF type:complete len:204 (+),score=43.15 TRINITY_DN3828_c0_g1_i1:42-614(+)
MSKTVSDLQIKKLQHAYQCWDADKDGKMTLDDYKLYAHKIATRGGLNTESESSKLVTEQFLKLFGPILHAADKNQDGVVTEEEFVEYFITNFIVKKDISQHISIAANIFKMIDGDGDGKISPSEYILAQWGWGISEESAKKAFSLMDLNNDGFITYDEYEKHFSDYWLSSDPNVPGNNFFGMLDDEPHKK